MQIHECMTSNVAVAAPNDTIQSAAQTMASIDAGILPVAEADHLIGMISDRDITVRGIAAGHGPETRVGEIMTSDVKYCFDYNDTEEVLQNMAEIQVRRLPVVDKNKRLVGIISIGDLDSEQPDKVGQALGGITRDARRSAQVA